jgi:hypothetical protein
VRFVEVIGESLGKYGLAYPLLLDQGQVYTLALLGQLGVVVQHSQHPTFCLVSGLRDVANCGSRNDANWPTCTNYSIILEVMPIGIIKVPQSYGLDDLSDRAKEDADGTG